VSTCTHVCHPSARAAADNPCYACAQGFFRQQTPGAGQGDGGGADAPAFNDAEFPTLGTGTLIAAMSAVHLYMLHL